MANADSNTNKQMLTPEKITAISQFWQSVTEATFTTHDNISIAYTTNFKRPNKPYVVIVPGRSESYLKYQELMYDFDQQGFDTVVIDHRGQGLSQRLLTNRFKGYVNSFDDYAQDLHQLLNEVIPQNYPEHHEEAFMLAHSMGGAIALRYLQLQQHKIKALVLSSPMIAISSGNIPKGLAKFVVESGSKLNQWFSESPWYFLGQSDSNQTSYQDNKLMHSQERFQRFQNLYQTKPELKLGGVTFKWLQQALAANKNIFSDLSKLSTPILLMQSGEEHIVDNSAQNEFCQQLHKIQPQSCFGGKPLTIDGAYHELLFEIDEYRSQALTRTLDWFITQH